ncbi:methyltransferase, FxLD system [Lentzea sp. DG1S-22]|uniref:methyltransferase, FxLD system n=1 Tax=Lentzea sp. DG1S-22 TaxID=3108822 RepID=UPI002E796C41|nr:methyltransferase, FxLD system [Lentzea sp. DG1S-22]WVH84361.1 methyltransferase, FxLD system [Lentzea sp. DG1S-22]
MNITTDSSPEALRAAMVDRIKAAGHAHTAAVEQALREVPRHRFVPAAQLTDAYANQAVITKRAADGAALSCASVPTVVAMMLDQLDVQPGHRILEIGAGTGYNAALLATLTGPTGHVTTVDIDPGVTAGARAGLDITGFADVEVITADGSLGAPNNAPYDRIIVTVGAFDIPPAWREELAPGGRLVVPLRWRGQTRSVAFVRDDDLLRSDSVKLCGFVPMIGQDSERSAHLDADEQVTLSWDADQDIDPELLHGVLSTPKTEVWSEVTVGGSEPFDGVWLRMTATESATCRIAADQAAVDSGLCTPAIPSRSPALAEGGSLAYFTYRRVNPDQNGGASAELGAIGHGRAGDRLALRLCDQIRAWGADRTGEPVVIAHSAEHPVEGSNVIKRWTNLTITF